MRTSVQDFIEEFWFQPPELEEPRPAMAARFFESALNEVN